MSGSPNTIFPFFPLLIAVPILTAVVLWNRKIERERRELMQRLAVAEGLAFHPKNQPIPLPDASYGLFTRMSASKNFMIGQRRGFDVFACDFRIGAGKGAHWATIVAQRGEVDANRFDPKQLTLKPHNGWTFILPRRSWAGRITPQQIGGMWDSMNSVALRRG